MSKALKLVSVSVLTALCGVFMASCGKSEEVHTHTWDSGVVTIQNTCNSKGLKTYTCSGCNETKTEILEMDPNNHLWDNGVVTLDPNCKEEGIKTYTCHLCGEHRTCTSAVTG